MKKAELKKEWLTSNAITAFAGALFVAYGWHISDDTIKLPFNLTLPGLPDCVYFALGSLLFVLAFVLLSGSIVPALRPWAFRTGSSFSPIFGLLAWVAFTLGWVSVIPVLQEVNQWWSEVLYWGGFAFLLFLALRLIFLAVQLFFSGSYRSKSDDDDPKLTEGPSLRAALFVSGFVLFICILGRISSGQSPEEDD